MKTFTRGQLREVLEAWQREPTHASLGPLSQGDSLFCRGAVDYLEYLDTYQFKDGGSMPTQRATGKVKWFNIKKGFGFIEPDETGKDVFVHMTGLRGATPKEGDKVEFDLEKTPKGFQAVDVILLVD